MPIVATDDAARRQEFIWLGPVNSPWPFEARGRAWVMAVLLCPGLVVLAGALAPRPLIEAVLPGPAGVLATGAFAVVVGVGAGVWITRAVGRLVSPTRPLAHHVALLGMEVAAPRQAARRSHRVAPAAACWIEDAPAHRRTRRLVVPAMADEQDDPDGPAKGHTDDAGGHDGRCPDDALKED